MPGMMRRGSKSKSPILIAEQAPETGLFGGTDFEDLKGLDYLSIEFSYAEGTFNDVKKHSIPAKVMLAGKTAFLRQAKFHGLTDIAVVSPVAFQSRSPTV